MNSSRLFCELQVEWLQVIFFLPLDSESLVGEQHMECATLWQTPPECVPVGGVTPFFLKHVRDKNPRCNSRNPDKRFKKKKKKKEINLCGAKGIVRLNSFTPRSSRRSNTL
eukprot:NODE_3552_length_657_cov_82.722039_g2536_i0.p1 GENE.NODE_3552_length_657_cov_82.722039_g2536_i0~~NODE_3552_length_657_cov_82.722039_g2536_i0.p1  ORF type:complete len:119 (+),score=12.15 NODE_3552_length_657_cov_82.722039_g2536_i0:26-358(+)